MNSPILVAPLHWGLGHATRCIPLIRRYLAENREVILASDGAALQLLQQEFPELTSVALPSYDIRYDGSPTLMLLKDGWRIRNVIKAEHQATEEIVAKFGIKEILSDNRYGVWSDSCVNKFLCHQLAPMPPKAFKSLHQSIFKIHQRFLAPFQELLVPDVAGFPNLSGDLSHKFPLPNKAKFIGILSRFEGVSILQKYENDLLNHFQPQIVAIISGPEPQRSLFQQLLEERFANTTQKVLMILGKPEIKDNKLNEVEGTNSPLTKGVGGIQKVAHLGTSDMAKVITQADLIISRSGYSSLMDYVFLNPKKVELYPTKGQTEQEYLADWWVQMGQFLHCL